MLLFKPLGQERGYQGRDGHGDGHYRSGHGEPKRLFHHIEEEINHNTEPEEYAAHIQEEADQKLPDICVSKCQFCTLQNRYGILETTIIAAIPSDVARSCFFR